jgi:predicted AlkP superfamily pyrophosphatase or phosphodiesterase
LLIVIAVDQLSADLFDEYRPQFTGGFARLAGGTWFRNGYQSHAGTETCPGHSTILTGARPARTGIVGNAWIDQSAGKGVYCAEDPSTPVSPSSGYAVSAVQLKVPTLGELLRQARPGAKSVAVSGKDRAAVMMGGHAPDQRWYWSGGKFATDLSGATPQSVLGANAELAAALATERKALVPPPFCAGKAQPVTLGDGRVVGAGAFARAAGDTDGFRASPEYDAAVLGLAAGLVGELQLGADATPDILAIGLSATDYVGHAYGSGGQEMCLQLVSLDRELGSFFALLDRRGLDYAVALTADHGGLDIPERLRSRGVPAAAWADPALEADAVGKRIAEKLGLSGRVLRGGAGGDIWLEPSLKPNERARALEEALAIYRAHPQVEAVYSREQISRTPPPRGAPDKWTLLERARASSYPGRSGDVLVILKPNITFLPLSGGDVGTHGGPWDYDRRVPIAFWRKGMAPAVREEPVETVDIMPTLAAMLVLMAPAPRADGKCLGGISGILCPRR